MDEKELNRLRLEAINKYEQSLSIPQSSQVPVENEFVPNLSQADIERQKKLKTAPSALQKAASFMESTGRGVTQGLSFGFADELEALAKSVAEKRPYADVLKESRARYSQSQKENPLTYKTSEFAGGVLPFFVPGAGQAATGTRLSQSVIRGAGLGGLSGLGFSEGETTGEKLKDVGLGMALGGGLPLGFAGAKKAAQSLKPIADDLIKTTTTGFTGKTRQFLEELDKNPEAVKRIESKFAGDIQTEILPEINAKINDFMTKNPYKQRAIAGSQKAIESIPDNITISRETGEKVIQNALSKLEKDTVSATAEDARLILNDYLKRFEKTKEQIPGRDIKITLQNLDNDIEKKFGGYGNPFQNDEASKSIKELRFAWDNELKTKADKYADIMRKVRRDAAASESLTNRFATREGVSSEKISSFTDRLLKRQEKIMSTPEVKADIRRIEAISRLPESEIGLQTLSRDIQDIGLKKAIEARGNQGSNLTNPVTWGTGGLGAAIGSLIGDQTGSIIGGSAGAYLGGIASRQLEQKGGKIAESILRRTKGIRTPTTISSASPIETAIQKGSEKTLLDEFLNQNRREVERNEFLKQNQNRVK